VAALAQARLAATWGYRMAAFNPELDRLLLAAVAKGMSRREFARRHGISEPATIARCRRLTDPAWKAEQNSRPRSPTVVANNKAKTAAKASAKAETTHAA
jgi:transposase